MSLVELLRTALHSLRINPIRSALAVIGVIFGIAAVVVLISMGQGVRAQITDQIKGLGTHLLIVRSGKEEALEDQQMRPSEVTAGQVGSSSLTDNDVKRITELKDYVEGATGTIDLMNKVEAGDSLTVKVIGGDRGFAGVRQVSFQEKKPGWSIKKQESGTCAIGPTVRDKLFGENAKDVIDKQVKIGQYDFTVKAVTIEKEKSFLADPNREVYIPIEDARSICRPGSEGKVLEIYVKAKQADEVEDAKERITEVVEDEHRKNLQGGAAYETDFHVATQEDLMASYKKILGILNALVIGVALVALAESGIGVSNIMYIAVKERTREIGVRLAQGASSRAIMTQFLFESVTICLLGAAVGVPLGWLVALLINSKTVLPAQTPFWGVLVAFGAATMVGVTAGMYPAWKATKADIAVVLRSE